MSRTPCIAGNWKMHKTVAEAVETAAELKEAVKDVSGRDIGIAPPFVSLVPVAEVLKGSNSMMAVALPSGSSCGP